MTTNIINDNESIIKHLSVMRKYMDVAMDIFEDVGATEITALHGKILEHAKDLVTLLES